MRTRHWTGWLGLNALVIIATPVLFGWWLDGVVTEEYRSGARVSTDGDTIAIPVSGITFLVTWFAIGVNAAVALVWLVRHDRQQGRNTAAYAGRIVALVVVAIVLAIGLPWLVISAVFGVLALLL